MSHPFRSALISGASLLATALLASCSGRATYEPPVAPEVAEPTPAVTVPNTARSDGTGLLGGPTQANPPETNGISTFRRADGVLVTAMRPIANPDEMQQSSGIATQARRETSVRSHVRHERAGPNPTYASKPARPAAEVALGTVPAPKTVQTVQTVRAAAKPPSATSQVKLVHPSQGPVRVAISTALPIPRDGKLAGLQAQLAPEVANDLTLNAPTEVTEGQSANVELALPASLLKSLQAEAPKHGLGAAARSVDVRATLSGQGYEITPSDEQTVALKAGKAATFFWVANRVAGPNGRLHVDVQTVLTGVRIPMEFALASLDTGPSAPAPVATAKKTWLGPLDATGQRTVLGAFLVLTALLIASLIARNARDTKRREERRRKFNAFTDYSVVTATEAENRREAVNDSQSEQRRYNDGILSNDTQTDRAD